MSIVHVNSLTIRSNQKSGKRTPPLSIRRSRSAKAQPASTVLIKDADGHIVGMVCYRPEQPLSCGARVWIETVYPAEGVLE